MARIRGRAERERELPEAPPQNDAYTGLLAISLLATLTGLIFITLDYSDYSAKVPKPAVPTSIATRAEPGAAEAPSAPVTLPPASK